MPPLQTDEDLTRWMMIIVLLYVAAGYLICFIRVGFRGGTLPSSRFGMAKVFDGATFASCVLLIVGAFDPTVFQLLGNTKLFLIVAGIAGALYTLDSLFAPA